MYNYYFIGRKYKYIFLSLTCLVHNRVIIDIYVVSCQIVIFIFLQISIVEELYNIYFLTINIPQLNNRKVSFSN